MKIRITKPGIFGAQGEIPIGAEFEVEAVPKSWEGRVSIISKDAESEAQAVTNPAKPPRADLEKRAKDLKLAFDAKTSDEDLQKAVEAAEARA